jgi:hypothetical protein
MGEQTDNRTNNNKFKANINKKPLSAISELTEGVRDSQTVGLPLRSIH